MLSLPIDPPHGGNRVSELEGIPSHITEVVIFEVEAEEDEEDGAFMHDASSVRSNGSGRGDDDVCKSQARKWRGKRRQRPVSVCLWKPVKRELTVPTAVVAVARRPRSHKNLGLLNRS